MIRLLATASICSMLAACDGEQPFLYGEDLDLSTDPIDPTDPNTSVNNLFAFDRNAGLTMNSVEYDAENDELVINNLPFDGPDGRYDFMQTLGAGKAYESRQTATTGLVKHYAVFIKSEHIEAAAAAGANWRNYGYGGANINRDSFSLPDNGEYVFLGDYSGVRTFDDRTGLELVSGDVEMILDVNDFDPVAGIQGAIVGTVSNRVITPLDGRAPLPTGNIGLVLVEFSTADGTFKDGGVVSTLADGSAGGSGSYSGFLAGDNGTDIGAHVVMTGPAYSQNVQYEIVTYRFPVTTVVQNPDGTLSSVVTYRTGEAAGLTATNNGAVQDFVNGGSLVPYLGYNPVDLPDDAEITSSRTESQLYVSGINAQEIGVLVAER